MIDYEILKLIWWLFIAVLLTGFAIMDGQDMGAGTLLPYLGKTNEERRIMINAVAPHWDGNEVWLITAGGVTFAADRLRDRVLRLLLGAAHRAVHADLPPGGLRLPQQG